MNPSFSLAREAAHAASGQQHYPTGCLYVVASPIGNLADISLRALHVLDLVDRIACEDTRHTSALLQAYGLHKPLLPVHQHNEAQAAVGIIEHLKQGERIAYLSDAGTPGISDPGARLCAAVVAADLPCRPLPGPSSVTALLSVAGLTERHDGPAFEFTGFLPAKGAERQRALHRLAEQPHACVLLESPHRMAGLATELAALGERKVTVGRELTKQFEETATLTCVRLPDWLAAQPNRSKGEFALVLHPLVPANNPADGQEIGSRERHVLHLLLEEMPLKTAVKLAVEITGLPRNTLYQAALQSRQNEATPPEPGP